MRHNCYSPKTHEQSGLQTKKSRKMRLLFKWCGAGSNRRHKDFQSFALPTELPHLLIPIFRESLIGAAKINVLRQRLKKQSRNFARLILYLNILRFYTGIPLEF